MCEQRSFVILMPLCSRLGGFKGPGVTKSTRKLSKGPPGRSPEIVWKNGGQKGAQWSPKGSQNPSKIDKIKDILAPFFWRVSKSPPGVIFSSFWCSFCGFWDAFWWFLESSLAPFESIFLLVVLAVSSACDVRLSSFHVLCLLGAWLLEWNRTPQTRLDYRIEIEIE